MRARLPARPWRAARFYAGALRSQPDFTNSERAFQHSAIGSNISHEELGGLWEAFSVLFVTMGKISLGPRGIRVHSPIRFKSHPPLKLSKTEKETILSTS